MSSSRHTAAAERCFDAGGPTLADVGEEEVLRLLRAVAEENAGARLVIAPGDDAAVWQPPAGVEVALTQDVLVEERDFRRAWITPRALGRRVMAVALSDLAAMGAEPAWCMATLCAPASTHLEDVLEIQRGLVAAAREARCVSAGGDVSDTPSGLTIDVSAGGTAPRGRWMRRDAGEPGDLLLVTGQLGGAAAGLRLLTGDDPVLGRAQRAWVQALVAPRARLREGRHLAVAGVRCAGDLSDGLSADVARTCAASRCGAELWLDHLPLAPGLERAFPDDWARLALAGGDDFELLCAASADLAASLTRHWPADLAPLREIGRLVSGTGVVLLASEGGAPLPLPRPRSWHWS